MIYKNSYGSQQSVIYFEGRGGGPPWADVRCAFCDAPPGTETGEAHTWGQDEQVTHPICVDCAIQTEPDLDERDHVACDGCGLVVDTLAASPAHSAPASSGTSGPARLTRFRVELGHLEGPLQLCERCNPGGLATYWTRNLEEHLVATPAE